MASGAQTFVVRLEPALARRSRAFLTVSDAYDDLSELMAVALENQLSLEGFQEESADDAGAEPTRASISSVERNRTSEMLRRPGRRPKELGSPARSEDPLYSLTNRLFPVMVAARVLANASQTGMGLAEFHRCAGRAARALGQELRIEDARARRKGLDRRWIALPVGEDEPAALARFVQHFTITATGDGAPAGPMALLGLASLDDEGTGLPQLTKRGAQLACAENALLDDGADTSLLSEQEREIFIASIAENPGELAAVRSFIGLVLACSGRQPEVDQGLRELHPGWSESQAVAQRASMLGRLHDLGLAAVEGRGPKARIELAGNIADYWKE